MRTTESDLSWKIRRTRGVLAEVIEQAELQGWRLRIKEDGFLFFPPPGAVRQGFESVFARDPGAASHAQKQMKDRFRKAGMKFPEDEIPLVRVAKMSQTTPTNQVPASTDNFAVMSDKISATVALLSEMEQCLGKIKRDHEKFNTLREAFKSLGSLS